MRGVISSLIVSLVALASLSAQQAVPTFKSGTRLIVQTVTVKDKNGRAIEGLTAKDFVVVEDGELQTVGFVEFQRLPDRRSDEPAAAVDVAPAFTPPGPRDPAAALVAALRQAQIVSPPPGDTLYRNRRLLVL